MMQTSVAGRASRQHHSHMRAEGEDGGDGGDGSWGRVGAGGMLVEVSGLRGPVASGGCSESRVGPVRLSRAACVLPARARRFGDASALGPGMSECRAPVAASCVGFVVALDGNLMQKTVVSFEPGCGVLRRESAYLPVAMESFQLGGLASVFSVLSEAFRGSSSSSSSSSDPAPSLSFSEE